MDETRQDAGQPISVDNAPRPNTGRRFPMWRWLARVAVALLIALAMAENLHTSWQRWGDVVIDCGRELDTPRQLAGGATLYKDIRYWYGPLPPYVNAVLFRIFGVHLSVITTAGMVVTALTAWLTYRLVRQFAARAPAAAAAVAFLYVCAFGHYLTVNIFNSVLPYACPATYGMLLAMASIYFLIRHAARHRNQNFVLSCVFLSLTALCKIEVLVAVAVPHAMFLLAWLLAGRLRRRFYLVSYAAAIALPVAVFGYFYARTGNELLADNLFLPGNVAASAFTLEHTGLDQPAESLKAVGIGSAALAGCLVALGVAAFAERRIRR
ncbi:MAG: glycosyltransferase family 39 protein, partial [Phycisphaerae bacterium]|nr:glycosyltransferase family 39 protein [Phycisphaerae bacterium]